MGVHTAHPLRWILNRCGIPRFCLSRRPQRVQILLLELTGYQPLLEAAYFLEPRTLPVAAFLVLLLTGLAAVVY